MTRRKIIVYIATSADGFIARKNGAVDWLDRPGPKGDYGIMKFFKSIDTIIMGRKPEKKKASEKWQVFGSEKTVLTS